MFIYHRFQHKGHQIKKMSVALKLRDGMLYIGKGMAMQCSNVSKIVEDTQVSADVIVNFPELDWSTVNLLVIWLSKHEECPIIDSKEIFSYVQKPSDEWQDLGARDKFLSSQKLITTEKLFDCWDRVTIFKTFYNYRRALKTRRSKSRKR